MHGWWCPTRVLGRSIGLVQSQGLNQSQDTCAREEASSRRLYLVNDEIFEKQTDLIFAKSPTPCHQQLDKDRESTINNAVGLVLSVPLQFYIYIYP